MIASQPSLPLAANSALGSPFPQRRLTSGEDVGIVVLERRNNHTPTDVLESYKSRLYISQTFHKQHRQAAFSTAR